MEEGDAEARCSGLATTHTQLIGGDHLEVCCRLVTVCEKGKDEYIGYRTFSWILRELFNTFNRDYAGPEVMDHELAVDHQVLGSAINPFHFLHPRQVILLARSTDTAKGFGFQLQVEGPGTPAQIVAELPRSFALGTVQDWFLTCPDQGHLHHLTFVHLHTHVVVTIQVKSELLIEDTWVIIQGSNVFLIRSDRTVVAMVRAESSTPILATTSDEILTVLGKAAPPRPLPQLSTHDPNLKKQKAYLEEATPRRIQLHLSDADPSLIDGTWYGQVLTHIQP